MWQEIGSPLPLTTSTEMDADKSPSQKLSFQYSVGKQDIQSAPRKVIQESYGQGNNNTEAQSLDQRGKQRANLARA